MEPTDGPVPPGNACIAQELDRVRRDYRELAAALTGERAHRRTNGTRWTNRQMLFHLLLGYLVVRVLLGLAVAFGRLPDGLSRAFAAVLNSSARPFHAVNYLGPVLAARLLPPDRMVRMMDGVTSWLAARRERETGRRLALRMHYPVRWDPFFRPTMTIAELYHYPTEHYDFHRKQIAD